MARGRNVVLDKKKHPSADVWRTFKRNKPAVVGMVVILFISLLALTAPLYLDYDVDVVNNHPAERLQGPNREHILGTDAFGRDMAARLIWGARYSLSFGFVCTAIALIGGGIIGAASAYFGGRFDFILMRILDAIMCIPGMLLALTLVSIFGAGLKSMMIAISISTIPSYTRIIRSVVLSVVREEYIEAARACGIGTMRTILQHVLPNAVGTIIVNAIMNIASLIMTAAALSFIGMGIQPPAPEWGAMLSEATQYMRIHPYLVLAPGLAILITALSFNLVGDGLSVALDPRMKN